MLHTVVRAVKTQHAAEGSLLEVAADRIATVAGSAPFLILHVLWFIGWILWNAGGFDVPRFDPFPFGLLTMIVSLEAIFLAIFILMSQNREARIGELREETTLAVQLRTEAEVTKLLQLVAGLYTRLGHQVSQDDDELREMLRPFDPTEIEAELIRQLRQAKRARRAARSAQAVLAEAGEGNGSRSGSPPP